MENWAKNNWHPLLVMSHPTTNTHTQADKERQNRKQDQLPGLFPFSSSVNEVWAGRSEPGQWGEAAQAADTFCSSLPFREELNQTPRTAATRKRGFETSSASSGHCDIRPISLMEVQRNPWAAIVSKAARTLISWKGLSPGRGKITRWRWREEKRENIHVVFKAFGGW